MCACVSQHMHPCGHTYVLEHTSLCAQTYKNTYTYVHMYMNTCQHTLGAALAIARLLPLLLLLLPGLLLLLLVLLLLLPQLLLPPPPRLHYCYYCYCYYFYYYCY